MPLLLRKIHRCTQYISIAGIGYLLGITRMDGRTLMLLLWGPLEWFLYYTFDWVIPSYLHYPLCSSLFHGSCFCIWAGLDVCEWSILTSWNEAAYSIRHCGIFVYSIRGTDMHKEPWLPGSLNFFNLFKHSNCSVNGQLLHPICGTTPPWIGWLIAPYRPIRR
jgi:hypothetical protein